MFFSSNFERRVTCFVIYFERRVTCFFIHFQENYVTFHPTTKRVMASLSNLCTGSVMSAKPLEHASYL
jgi:hypothetical protein